MKEVFDDTDNDGLTIKAFTLVVVVVVVNVAVAVAVGVAVANIVNDENFIEGRIEVSLVFGLFRL
jgi:ABC-type sulfate transport system permease subunit